MISGFAETGEDESTAENGSEPPEKSPAIDRAMINAEIEELDRYIKWARSIGIDTKSRTLLNALDIGFSEMDRMGANRRALIFTESRRTQDYLKSLLESNGHAGRVILFNGTNGGPESRAIYDSVRW